MRKTNQLSIRLPDALREELEKACELTGLDGATVARACLQAFVEHIRDAGQISLPLAIVPKSELGGKKPNLTRSTLASRVVYAEDIGVPSSASTARLNEDPPAPGPHPRSTRPGVKKTIEREKGKSPS